MAAAAAAAAAAADQRVTRAVTRAPAQRRRGASTATQAAAGRPLAAPPRARQAAIRGARALLGCLRVRGTGAGQARGACPRECDGRAAALNCVRGRPCCKPAGRRASAPGRGEIAAANLSGSRAAAQHYSHRASCTRAGRLIGSRSCSKTVGNRSSKTVERAPGPGRRAATDDERSGAKRHRERGPPAAEACSGKLKRRARSASLPLSSCRAAPAARQRPIGRDRRLPASVGGRRRFDRSLALAAAHGRVPTSPQKLELDESERRAVADVAGWVESLGYQALEASEGVESENESDGEEDTMKSLERNFRHLYASSSRKSFSVRTQLGPAGRPSAGSMQLSTCPLTAPLRPRRCRAPARGGPARDHGRCALRAPWERPGGGCRAPAPGQGLHSRPHPARAPAPPPPRRPRRTCSRTSPGRRSPAGSSAARSRTRCSCPGSTCPAWTWRQALRLSRRQTPRRRSSCRSCSSRWAMVAWGLRRLLLHRTACCCIASSAAAWQQR